MVFDVTLVSWAGVLLQKIAVKGLHSDVCAALAAYPGAGSAIVTDAHGNVETLGKGAAFVIVDGASKRAGAVVRVAGPTRSGQKVRGTYAWHIAAGA
jgi:hypothetical protein